MQDGGCTWLLAKLPQRYIISGDEITLYLVFMNSYDGTGAIKAAMPRTSGVSGRMRIGLQMPCPISPPIPGPCGSVPMIAS